MQTAMDEGVLRPLRRRWLMLALFCSVSFANGFQWIQYAIISDSVAWYYGVSTDAVDWTSMLYMVTFIPCILPASWILNKQASPCVRVGQRVYLPLPTYLV